MDLMRTIEDLYALGPRRVGTEESEACIEYLERRFRDAGLEDVRRESVPVHRYRVDQHSLTIDGKPFPSFYIPYTRLTGDDGVSGPLARSPGTGKIVVADIRFPMLRGKALKTLALGVHDPDGSIPDGDLHPATWIRQGWDRYAECRQKGAIGFIGILCDQPGGHDSYYAPYGFREGDRILDKPLPGMWVSKRHRDELIRLCQRGATARVRTVGEVAPTTSDNLIGEVRGETDETIVIGCHHDSPFAGAVQDASGLSVVLDLAERTARSRPKRTLLFLATTGHFHGSAGTRGFVARHADRIARTVVAAIHVEHIALEAEEREGALHLTGRSETVGFFTNYNKIALGMVRRMLEEHHLDRTIIFGAHGPLGDYPPSDGGDFYAAGVPVFNFISNPVYLLVDDDGLDRVDRDRLRRVSDGFLGLLRDLDTVDREALRRKDFPLKRAQARAFTLLNRLKASISGLGSVLERAARAW